jgi:N6-L-threonylcarbamoyladenine synthase
MLILGLESSCDETGAAVVDDRGRVLSDVVQSQIAVHAPYGGVVPELASRDHLKNVGPVVREALARAGLTLADVDAIAVTHRPGLVGALLVGVQTAKGLAWGAGKPLVGVDHLVGHLFAVFLDRDGTSSAPASDARPAFPFVALLASGGHTALYRVDAARADSITELGGTRDDAAGEAFDKVGKLLGLGYPGGPVIDRLAAIGDPRAVPLEAPMLHDKGLDFSFSGIKTKIAYMVQAAPPKDDRAVADLCASFQRAVVTVLVDKLLRAAAACGVTDVVIGGGVAANRGLRAHLADEARARGMRAFVPSLASCTDNAAMIAYAGALKLATGARDGWDLIATSSTALPRATRKGRGAR